MMASCPIKLVAKQLNHNSETKNMLKTGFKLILCNNLVFKLRQKMSAMFFLLTILLQIIKCTFLVLLIVTLYVILKKKCILILIKL